jgi:Fe-S cluster assembly scaffold protein SufB
MKHWIWDDNKKQFRTVDSSRLDYNYRYNPDNCARMDIRNYVYYVIASENKQDCWDKATIDIRKQIAELEEKLIQKKEELAKFGNR